jgi:hypothetical protein
MKNFSSSKVDLIEKVPYWKQITISNEGKVEIYFSEEFVIPANATLNVDSAVLNL